MKQLLDYQCGCYPITRPRLKAVIGDSRASKPGEVCLTHSDAHNKHVDTLVHGTRCVSRLDIPCLEFHFERLQNMTSTDWGSEVGVCLVIRVVFFKIRFGVVWSSFVGSEKGWKSLQKISWRYWSYITVSLSPSCLPAHRFRPSAAWVTDILTQVSQVWTPPPAASSCGRPKRGVAASECVRDTICLKDSL